MFGKLTFKKTVQRLLVMVVFITTLLTAQPAFAANSQPNPAAEAYLLENLRLYGYADLSFFSDFETDRVVDGFFLSEALKDPQVLSQPGIYIANTTVAGDFSVIDYIIPSNLVFINTQFEGEVYFNNAQLQGLAVIDSSFLGDLSFVDAAIARGINFQGNSVQGSIYFSFSTVQRDVYIINSYVGGNIDLSNAVVELGVVISGNDIGSLIFMRTTANKNVDLSKNTINNNLNFYGARVAGELLMDQTTILGTEPLEGATYPIAFENASVAGLASFTEMTIAGDAYFYNFYCGNTMDFSGTTFEADALFENASAVRAATFERVTFNGKAIFDFFTAERFLDFTHTAFMQDFSLYYATVAWPYFSEVDFNGPVNFEGMRASEDFELSNSRYNYTESPFAITLADIVGTAKFENFTAPAGLALTKSQFGSLSILATENTEIKTIDLTSTWIQNDLLIKNISMDSFVAALANIGGTLKMENSTAPAGITLTESAVGSVSIHAPKKINIAIIDLRSTTINGDLTLSNIALQSLLAESASISGSTGLYQLSIEKQLDLRNTGIGFLKVDENFQWPNDPNAFNLRGMAYTDIDLGDRGLTEDTWQGLLLLIEQSAYSPQAYEALAQFLTDKGHPEWASQVKFANKVRERDEILTRPSGGWVWSWFLYLFAGYGYRPYLAFIWSGLVVLYGTFVFRRKEDMLAVDQGDVPLPYSPLLYSFSLFLPYIDIDVTSKWDPSPANKWAHKYKYIHMLLGWVLAPIALLAFGGIFG